MFTYEEVAKLGVVHTVEPMVLSVYLSVPERAAALGDLPARASELIMAAEKAAGPAGRLRAADRDAVREKLAAGGRDWLGRTVAVFACAEAGLFEAFALPGQLRERAVLGVRPHIRPLLVALQRPEQHVRWLAADQILTAPPGAPVAVGLPACLAAVDACAVQTLIVPEDGLVPGYECGRCGALSTEADTCPDWGTAALPVPDVIEEMVTRALEDGARVSVIRGARSPVAATLRSPGEHRLDDARRYPGHP
jgi:hypothetical protein